jgi:hypothetical protein
MDMTRIEATSEIVSREFASRPVRVALAVKIALAILGADVSLAAAKAYFAQSEATAPVAAASVSSAAPFILPLDGARETYAAAANCHEVVVQTDEGYGVRGEVTRTVCRKAL